MSIDKLSLAMTSNTSPKVVLFDIGGVVVRHLQKPRLQRRLADLAFKVLSPFQGILDFERKYKIPHGWTNFAIRYHSPNGHWQRLERGEIKMDVSFFEGFTEDLHDEKAWREYNGSFRSEKKKLKDTANPTQLGDHVSLKAEIADSKPGTQDASSQAGSSPASTEGQRPSLSKLAEDSTIGDPVSLEAEDVVEGDGGSGTAPAQERQDSSKGIGGRSMPKVEGEELFWTMMSASREPDPYIFPALERLSKQKPRPILGALSNTVRYLPDHPWSKGQGRKSGSKDFITDPASLFDVFIASADVGMRKPSRDIYELALQRLNDYDRSKGGQGIEADQIVFLDDIGENLKTAKGMGMKTIRVQLGKTWRAVKEVEGLLGVELMDETTRRAKL